MLALVPKIIEVLAPYPRQAELETLITRLVDKYVGIKETDLWLRVGVSMTGLNSPPPAIIAGTIHRMIRCGHLIGVDYEIDEHANTFVLPAGTHTAVNIPIRVIRHEPPLTMSS